jgi:hypothetical protein
VTRNTLRGPGTAQVDFSAIKNFPLFERLTAQFRAEAFDIINHPTAVIQHPIFQAAMLDRSLALHLIIEIFNSL